MKRKNIFSYLFLGAAIPVLACPGTVFAAWQSCSLPGMWYGEAVAIDIDSKDQPHILSPHRYVHKEDSVWLDMPMTGLDIYPYLEFAFKLFHDQPRVAYTSDYTDGFCYSYYDGIRWNREVINSDYLSGMIPSMVFDSSGNPHISSYSYYFYYGVDFATGTIMYSYRTDASSWTESSIGGYADPARSMIALDSSGTPHIVYRDEDKRMMYSVRTSTGWSSEMVFSSSSGYVSQQIDAHDRVHLSFMDFTCNHLAYALYDGVNWSTASVDSTGSNGWLSRILLDSHGQPHILYLTEPLSLMHSWYDGHSWASEKIIDVSSTSIVFGAVMDSQDHIHIALSDHMLLYISNDPSFPDREYIKTGDYMKVTNSLFYPSRGEQAAVTVNADSSAAPVIYILATDAVPVRRLDSFTYFFPNQLQFSWNGRDNRGDYVSSGIYFARLVYERSSSWPYPGMKKICVIR